MANVVGADLLKQSLQNQVTQTLECLERLAVLAKMSGQKELAETTKDSVTALKMEVLNSSIVTAPDEPIYKPELIDTEFNPNGRTSFRIHNMAEYDDQRSAEYSNERYSPTRQERISGVGNNWRGSQSWADENLQDNIERAYEDRS